MKESGCNSSDLAFEYFQRFHVKGDRSSIFAFNKIDEKVRKEQIDKLKLDNFSSLGLKTSGEVEKAIDDLISYSDLDILTKQDIEDLAILLASELCRNQEEVASRDLERMTWTLWENTTPFPFWTSDHPVVFQGPFHKSGKIENRESIIYFPLNPRLCIVLYGRHLELDIVGKARNRNLFRILGDQESFVKQQNSLQLDSCHRFIISNSEDFRYARKLRSMER